MSSGVGSDSPSEDGETTPAVELSLNEQQGATNQKAISNSSPGIANNTTGQKNDSKQIGTDNVIKAIALGSKQGLMQPLVTMTMYVPTPQVGALIGRKGQNIANLQKQASASFSSSSTGSNQPVRISVVAQDTQDSIPYTFTELDWSDPKWTPVVIRGPPVAALFVASKIEGSVEEVDEVILDLPINRTKHASIVGKRGMGIAALSADTNVRIMVPSKTYSNADIIQLEGNLSDVRRCLSLLLPLAAKAKPPKQEEKTVNVKTPPSQTKLRNLSRKRDCIIRKKKADNGLWTMIVSGNTTEQVDAVIAQLKQHDEETSNHEGAMTSTTTPSPARTPKRGGGKQHTRSKKGNNNSSSSTERKKTQAEVLGGTSENQESSLPDSVGLKSGDQMEM